MHKEQAAAGHRHAAERVKRSFQRFWNPPRAALFDVIDGPDGDPGQDGQRYDGRLRPNQILAVSLPHSPLDPARQKAVADACARELLTSHGLRSLAPGEPGYVAHYTGGPRERDGAYHQGTVWAWLIGPFVDAHYRVYGDAATARSFLEPLILHLESACLGSISEIFDADPPFAARGCFVATPPAADPSSANRISSRPTRISAITSCSTNTFTAIPGAASAPRIRPDGRDWSPSCCNHTRTTNPGTS